MLLEDLKEVIRKSLPTAIGEELQSELKELARLRVLHTEHKELSVRYDALTERLAKYQDLDSATAKLASEKEAHRIAVSDLRVAIAENAVKEAEKRANVVTDLVGMIFKSPVMTKVTTGNIPVGVGGYGNGAGYVSSQNPLSLTETLAQT
jgi:hypothetical protein